MSENIGTAHNITKSNTPNDRFNMVMVTTTTGTLDVDQEGGNNVVITSVPVGIWIPIGNGINIRTASTAVGILVF